MTAHQAGGDTAANDPVIPKPPRSASDLRSGEYALLQALLLGPVTREAADRISGASNGPDVVFELRAGGIGIDTEWRKGTNKFDQPVRFGVYSLSTAGHTKATAMFRLAGQQAADQKRRPEDDARA